MTEKHTFTDDAASQMPTAQTPSLYTAAQLDWLSYYLPLGWLNLSHDPTLHVQNYRQAQPESAVKPAAAKPTRLQLNGPLGHKARLFLRLPSSSHARI